MKGIGHVREWEEGDFKVMWERSPLFLSTANMPIPTSILSFILVRFFSRTYKNASILLQD